MEHFRSGSLSINVLITECLCSTSITDLSNLCVAVNKYKFVPMLNRGKQNHKQLGIFLEQMNIRVFWV